MANKTDEQKFPIFTNNLKVSIDRKNVDRYFDIYQVGTKDLFLKDNVLDLPSEKYKAQSVAYYQRTRWFAMFNKGVVNFNDLKSEIQSIDESAIVNEVDLFNDEFKDKDAIKDVELAQLLVNSLKNRSSEMFSYNNLTGNLYYAPFSSNKSKSIEFLKLRFYEHANIISLEANTETFSETESLKKYGKSKAISKYVMDCETGEFRRILCNDVKKGAQTFDKGALSRKGARKKFLDFSEEEKFRDSKTGIIASFLSDVKENLSEFITISQIPLTDYNNCEDQRDDYENTDYAKFISKKGICISDTVNSTASKLMKEKMIHFLKTEYSQEAVSEAKEKGKYTIEIIHNKESGHYASKDELKQPSLFDEFNKPEDQHNLFNEDEIIQHITVEDSSDKIEKALKDVMHNIVQELIIKGDIVDKQITLVNWHEPKEWTFVKCGKGKWNKQKNSYNFCYYKMTVSQNGKLDFVIFDDKDYPENNEQRHLINIFQNYNNGNKNQYSNIECVVYNNINEINVIYKTKQFTLPNIEEFARIISLSDGNRKIVKNELVQHLKEFIEIRDLSDEEKKDFDLLFNKMQNESGSSVSYKSLLSHTDSENKKHSLIKRKMIKAFVEWLRDKTANDENQILLHAQIKSASNLKKHFCSFLGIKSLYMNGQFKYFVGKKKSALQTSLATSCVIRDVIPWNLEGVNKSGKILFDELKHMLSVEFVRNGQYTVIPFPMKYLNEHIRFCEKDINFEEE